MKKNYFLVVLVMLFASGNFVFSQSYEDEIPNPVTPDKVINVEHLVPKPHIVKDNTDVSGNNTPEAVNLYTVGYTTGITYTPVTGGTAVTSWRGSSSNDNMSNNQPIGFVFVYNGNIAEYFRVSTNGFVTFNTTTTVVGDGSDGILAYGSNNTQFSAATTATAGTSNALAVLYDNLAVSNLNNIVYKTTGTPGNRVCTIEWIGATFSGGTDNLNFQVKLYESDGHIEYVYGTMTQVSTFSYTLGINAATVSAAPTAAQLLTQQTANTAIFSNTVQNALATVPVSNSMITFTGVANLPAPSGLNFTGVQSGILTLNWTDNSTGEFSFGIFQSVDGGVTYSFIGTVAANAVTVTLGGLDQLTTYTYKVAATVENNLSFSAPAGTTTLASPIAGAYTIDFNFPTGGTNFTNFLDCNTALINNGISGPVTISVAGGNYPEVVTLTKIGGTSAVNTIKFTGPVSAEARVVVNPVGTSATNNYAIGLLGSDWVTFENIDVLDGGTSTANQIEYGYYLQSFNFLDGAENNTIKNANITLGGGGTVPGFSHGVLQSTITSARQANNNNKYLNLNINSSDRGIGIFGLSAPSLPMENNIEIANCILGQTTPLGDNITGTSGSAIGIIVSNCNNVNVHDNTLVSLRATNAANTQAIIGISGQNSIGDIHSNKILEVTNFSTSATVSVRAIGIQAGAVVAGNQLFYNNFISGISKPSQPLHSTITVFGIRSTNFAGGNGINEYYYNSIYLAGTGVNYASTCFGSFAGGVFMVTYDNIFYNNVSTSSATASSIAIQDGNAQTAPVCSGLLVSNFNDLYAPGTNGQVGANTNTAPYVLRNTLALWKSNNLANPLFTNNACDTASSSVNVNFVNSAAGDLHLTGSSIGDINLLGTEITGISTDIDGNPRGVKPYMGADESTGLSGLTLKLNWESCPNAGPITVELRSGSSPYGLIESANGTGGGNVASLINFGNAADGTPYYVVVKSANSVETWSAGTVTFSSHAASYDFTTSISQAYGNNQKLSGGIPSIYQGDANQDGFVNTADVLATYNNASAFITAPNTDFNCDGITDITDVILAYNNSTNFIQKQRP